MRSRVRLFWNFGGAEELASRMLGCKVAGPKLRPETLRMALHQGLQGFPEARGKVIIADHAPRDSMMRFPGGVETSDPRRSGAECDLVAAWS